MNCGCTSSGIVSEYLTILKKTPMMSMAEYPSCQSVSRQLGHEHRPPDMMLRSFHHERVGLVAHLEDIFIINNTEASVR